ncbi:hypothetical protein KO465_03830 [Candidatus Micrarchaeota archaeon]|nr:hypothetical protein [Candidatus Micrarchaeota archaeon]
MGCDKFMYYLNVLVFILLLVLSILFIINSQNLEAILFLIISYFIIPSSEPYDSLVKGKKIILKKKFRKHEFQISDVNLRLYYKNPQFPYLSQAVLTFKNEEYMLANNKVCWNWCVNNFLKDYVEKGGKAELFIDDKLTKLTNKDLSKGEEGFLELLIREANTKQN